MKINSRYSAKFNSILGTILNWEGAILEHDPNDPGGRTICGISQRAYPDWVGWPVVASAEATGYLKMNGQVPIRFIEDHITPFYHAMIWDKYSLENYDAKISFELFDQAVNPGPAVMTKNLQTILKALNFSARSDDILIWRSSSPKNLGNDIRIDGDWGSETVQFLQHAIDEGYAEYIAYLMNCMQGTYYINIAADSVKKRRYTKGLLKRVMDNTL